MRSVWSGISGCYLGGSVQVMGGGEYRLCKFRGGWGDLVMDGVHNWLCWPWSCGSGAQAVCTV